MRIEVHSKSDCPWCVKAKEWLDERGHPFTEVPHEDPAERQSFYDSLGLKGTDRAVPQIFIVDEGERYRVGGYDKLGISGL